MNALESSTPSLPSGPRERFATTQWTVVLSAGRRFSPEARQALAALCQSYWQPIYAYARRWCGQVEDARDLVQGFFAELLEKQYLAAATPTRGRFRSFLLTAFQHYVSRQRAQARAQKRGGGRRIFRLDFDAVDSRIDWQPAGGRTPEEQFERQWALRLLERVVERLETEMQAKGKSALWASLKPFLLGEHGSMTYAAAARKLAMTEAAAKMAASRLRKRYRELLREEIAQTVSDPQDLEDELRELLAVLSR